MNSLYITSLAAAPDFREEPRLAAHPQSIN